MNLRMAVEIREELIFDVTAAEFDARVLQRSHGVPVVVDFWAAWCGPCRALGPVLEQAITELDGRVLLAKVDTDRQAALAARYQIRGIPAVKAFAGGRVVDEFTGARDSRFVRHFLSELAPPKEVLTLRAAQALLQKGEAEQAEALLNPLLQDPEVPAPRGAALWLARARLVRGHLSEAQAALDQVDPRGPDAEAADGLRQLLDFYRCGDEPADAADSSAARYAEAARRARSGDLGGALERLVELVGEDRRYRDDGARKAMLLLFQQLGPDHDLVHEYRRRLQVIL